MADDLCCSICMFRFNESSYLPLWLQCGHTFCKSCLEDIKRRGKLKCPNCNAEDPMSIDSLPKNYFVLEMIVRGVFSRTTAGDEPWTCKLHPTENLTYYAPATKSFLCTECVKYSSENKVVNIDKTRLRNLMKPYAGFYEAASFEDMDSRMALLEHLESMLQGESARVGIYERQLHDGAVVALEAAVANCRHNIETYYTTESDRVTSATGVLKSLRELKELGQGFDILNKISVAKQMEIIPPLLRATTARSQLINDRSEAKFQYRLPNQILYSANLMALAGSRLFQESNSGEDVCEYKIQRFGNIGNRWGIYDDKNQVEAVTFTSSKSIFLTGIGMGTCYSVGKNITVQELNIIHGKHTGGTKIATETGLVLSNVDNSVKIGKLPFSHPIEIRAMQEYTIRLVAKGEAGVYRGQSAHPTVTGPKQVEFVFKSSSYSADDVKNGDNVSDGPILELFYQVSRAELLTIRRFQSYRESWSGRSGSRDCVTFKCDKNAKLNGLGICAPTQPGPAMVTVEVLEGGKYPGKLLFALPTAFLLPYSPTSPVIRVLFPVPLALKSKQLYTIQAGLTGTVYSGDSGLGTTITQGPLTLEFSRTLYESGDQSNGDNLLGGPIAELLFGEAQESENLYGKVYTALGSVKQNMKEVCGGETRLRRFGSVEPGWSIDKERKEALTLQFQHNVLLSAFGIAAAADVGQSVTLTNVRILAGNSLDSKVIYASAKSVTLYTVQGQDPVHRVPLQPPVELGPMRCYTLIVTMQNCSVYQGFDPLPEISTEAIGLCRFLPTEGIPEVRINSGDRNGPIIDLYCVPPDSNPQRIKEEISAVLLDSIDSSVKQVQFCRYADVGSSWHVNNDGKQVEAITFRPGFQGQLVALGVGNSYQEGGKTQLKCIELRRGTGTRGEILYEHSQVVELTRLSAADFFVKVALTRSVPVLPGEYYTLRVQYQENSVVVRGTQTSASVTEEGATLAFQRANFEGGDVENGSHETHGPLRDLYFVIG